MIKQKTFYRNSGDTPGADLVKALEYAKRIDSIFDVKRIVVDRTRRYTYEDYHTTIKIYFV